MMDALGLLISAYWPWLIVFWFLVVGFGIKLYLGYSIRVWGREKINSYASNYMPPSDDLKFKRRINSRVQWLRWMEIWKNFRILQSVKNTLPRPLVVIFIFSTTLIFSHFFLISLSDVASRLEKFVNETGNLRGQTVLLVFGIPVAFVLWWFRDMHVRATLENQRKDVNLKEFQEIQMRVAGAMDENKYPASARKSLQIAATHQLAGFLKGEYGESFQRPAWELLRARLIDSSERAGYDAIIEYVYNWHTALQNGRIAARKLGIEIRSALLRIRADDLAEAQRQIICDEWRTVFGSLLPKTDSAFSGLNAQVNENSSAKRLLSKIDLQRCHLVGAQLNSVHLEFVDFRNGNAAGANFEEAHLEFFIAKEAHFEGANLSKAHLERADFRRARLQGSILNEANLQGANLNRANFQGADLRLVDLEGAFMKGASFEGADLSYAKFDESTDMRNATFDNATAFTDNWDNLTSTEKDKHRRSWIERGLKRTDARKIDS